MLALRAEAEAHAAIPAFRVAGIRHAQAQQAVLHVRHELRVCLAQRGEVDAAAPADFVAAPLLPVFASGEIRQIASVEKRQFGSAEIRQFESIEKSQS